MSLSGAIEWLARALALMGGAALCVVTLLTVLSIVGRALMPLGLSPIAGDIELVEGLTGFAIFCFLPICQLHRGHVVVDLFTNAMGPRAVRVVDALSEVVMTFVLAIIAWRLTAGTVDKFNYGEVTFIRQLPVWWFYAACLVPAYGSVLTGLLTSARAVYGMMTGRDMLPQHQSAE